MHDQHDPASTDPVGSEGSIPAPGGASWRFRHSPAGGAPEPDPAPGAAGPDQRQGAPDGKAATEGGSQPAAGADAKKRKSRPRGKTQSAAYSVRLHTHEHAMIDAAAKHDEISLAGFLAKAGLAAARDRFRSAAAIADDRDVLSALFVLKRHFGWAGSNLNQVAHALNSGGRDPNLDQAIADVLHTRDALQDLIDHMLNRHKDQTA
ncbi:mobilization protein [Streptomyces sp. NBC_01304]|uniref:mobilization protein n=1 Tax=Streptomyces sp. NBC_01304 TaxID=2903818 RepID=UPI002E0EA3FE|nr:mobilization protein [Streptomyces sp. NBC_01304]